MDKSLKSRLTQAKRDHDHWCDQLNLKWAEVESTAISLNVAKEVVVHLRTEDPHPADECKGAEPSEQLLGFRRLDKGWCICYGVGPQASEYWEHPWAWKPILECSRDQRVEATKAVPQLLTRIVEEAEATTSEVEQALATLSEAIAPLRS